MIDAHEIWVASQLLPNEGIEDAVERIENLLSEEYNTSKQIDKTISKIAQWAENNNFITEDWYQELMGIIARRN